MQKKIQTLLFILLFVPVLPACNSSPSSTQTSQSAVKEVGFDLDDTLVFSSPAFENAFRKDVEPFSDKFWGVVNASDADHSCIKPRTKKILMKHKKKGREIYIITAREPHNTEPARRFVHKTFGIPKDHLYFEPNGKTRRLKQLGIDIYYGDSNSDITDAQAADIKSIRVQRSPESNYQEKYDPGKYGEKVLKNSASHVCK
jgi:acid phosphatase (class B)